MKNDRYKHFRKWMLFDPKTNELYGPYPSPQAARAELAKIKAKKPWIELTLAPSSDDSHKQRHEEKTEKPPGTVYWWWTDLATDPHTHGGPYESQQEALAAAPRPPDESLLLQPCRMPPEPEDE